MFEQLRDRTGALGDATMHLADAKNGVVATALGHAPVHPAGFVQVHHDLAGDAAQGAAPADDTGKTLVVHAILQRHSATVGGQVGQDQVGSPLGIVGLGADEGDIEGLFARQLRHIANVERADRRLEGLLGCGAGHGKTVRLHACNVSGPGVYQDGVEAGARHVGADVATDGAGGDDGDAWIFHVLDYCRSPMASPERNMRAKRAVVSGERAHLRPERDRRLRPRGRSPRRPARSCPNS